MDKDALIIQLGDALETLMDHFGYCGGGDAWERECWQASGEEKQVDDAIAAYNQYKEKTDA